MLAGLCAQPTPRGSRLAPERQQPAVEGSNSGSSSSCARKCVGVGAGSQVLRRSCRSRARSDVRSCRHASNTVSACQYECMMWTHTDNLCVSDLMFHVYIHMLPQKAFRTDYIDLTGRYQLQSAGRRQYTRPTVYRFRPRHALGGAVGEGKRTRARTTHIPTCSPEFGKADARMLHYLGPLCYS